ncbi:patatin-like phospholipase family protein [uncultured Algibacter sp.]|uniref:patatin-like phospholipase family protein n=1 Tax=uncultured Algibacter sp. TaxID=298659 RepID=UPI0026396FB4|nr:patatin-like phospholipase family protein [uncultured Algibacter sp.]
MYKILSLDGGGSWAIIQLLTLKDRYGNLTGHQVLQKFDLVIANSGGSIVLAALAENWTLEKALTLFDNKDIRESIFSENTYRDSFFPVDYLRLFKIPFGPKYSSKQKKDSFEKLFKEVNKRQMSELPAFIKKESLKIVVCTYDALNNRAKFFKSYGVDSEDYDSVRLTQAIHGSSNAPVQYFDFPARFKAKNSEIYYELWDGALGGFNNPILAGLIEAFKLGVPLKDIKLVSIGTGNKLMSLKEKNNFWKWKQIAIKKRRKKLDFKFLKPQAKFFKVTVLNQAKTILYQPPDTANYIAMMFLKMVSEKAINEHIVRLSPLIHSDSSTSEDVVPLINKLYALDMDITKEEEIQCLMECFDMWQNGEILNQPLEFKVKRDNDIVFINGNKYYKDGMDTWISWGF